MKGKLAEFFRVPREIRRDFWQDTVQHNRLSLLVICIMIFGMELFNMARVLVFSNSGLSTQNNRIYFGMYCMLFLVAALYLVLHRVLRKRGLRVRWAVQYVTALCMLLGPLEARLTLGRGARYRRTSAKREVKSF